MMMIEKNERGVRKRMDMRTGCVYSTTTGCVYSTTTGCVYSTTTGCVCSAIALLMKRVRKEGTVRTNRDDNRSLSCTISVTTEWNKKGM